MAMADAGIQTKNSSISLDEFIKYREIIEPTIPLSSDLLAARLGFLPRLQRRWKRVKSQIQNCLRVRTVEDLIDRDPGLPSTTFLFLESIPIDFLDLNEVSFILNTSSSELRYSKHDVCLLLFSSSVSSLSLPLSLSLPPSLPTFLSPHSSKWRCVSSQDSTH
jgi:hypothetical protein